MTSRTFNPLSSTTKPVQRGWAGQAKVAAANPGHSEPGMLSHSPACPLPSNTRTATGVAGGVGEQRVLDLREILRAVPGVPAVGRRAFRAGHPGRGQVVQRHPWGSPPAPDTRPRNSSRSRPGGPAGDPGRAYTSSVPAPATARSALRSQAVRVAGFEAGATARERINAAAGSRIRPAGPSSAGSPELLRGGPHRGDVPVRHRPVDRDRRGGVDQVPAGRHGPDRGDRRGRQVREVRARLVADLAVFTEGAAQRPVSRPRR